MMPQRVNPLDVLIEFCAVDEAIAIYVVFSVFPKLIHGPQTSVKISGYYFQLRNPFKKLKSLNKEIHLLENYE